MLETYPTRIKSFFCLKTVRKCPEVSGCDRSCNPGVDRPCPRGNLASSPQGGTVAAASPKERERPVRRLGCGGLRTLPDTFGRSGRDRTLLCVDEWMSSALSLDALAGHVAGSPASCLGKQDAPDLYRAGSGLISHTFGAGERKESARRSKRASIAALPAGSWEMPGRASPRSERAR